MFVGLIKEFHDSKMRKHEFLQQLQKMKPVKWNLVKLVKKPITNYYKTISQKIQKI